jgi:hypothetical protein
VRHVKACSCFCRTVNAVRNCASIQLQLLLRVGDVRALAYHVCCWFSVLIGLQVVRPRTYAGDLALTAHQRSIKGLAQVRCLDCCAQCTGMTASSWCFMFCVLCYTHTQCMCCWFYMLRWPAFDPFCACYRIALLTCFVFATMPSRQ